VTLPHSRSTVDDLLDRAFVALAQGDRATANLLAGQVLAVDRGNPDAEDLLAAPVDSGEIRRLTIMFADLVDSTALSTQVEPEVYRTVVGRYKELVRDAIGRYEGHIGSIKGDGLLIVFGHPIAHENDAQRAVQAGLDITRGVVDLSERVRLRFGFDIHVRVGIHRGVVYLDLEQDDVYGLAANLAARVSGLAPPDGVVVSTAIEPMARGHFELVRQPAQQVKGIDDPVDFFHVVAEQLSDRRPPPGHVVGRHNELTYLEQAWQAAVGGNLQAPGVALKGEAGIGKSRVAAAAADFAHRSGSTVMTLMGSPFHTDVGLHPVRRYLESRCGITRSTSPTERLQRLSDELDRIGLPVADTVPLLAPVLGLAPDAGYTAVPADGRKLYEHITDAVHRYLRARVGDGPALILAEDMHWFDEDTLHLVHAVLDDETGRLLVVMTGRESGSLPDDHRVVTFELKPFTANETDELILALHPGMVASERDAVHRRCDGVPLYIEEVVAKIKARAGDGRESLQVPDTLYEALFARLRADRRAARVVEAAATIGSYVDPGLLRAVLGLSESEVGSALDHLTANGVLTRSGAGWRFRHELLREVAAELSPPSARRRLHNRIADAVAATVPDSNPDWPMVAGHYERAGRHFEAALAFQQAASDARRRGSVGEARTHLGSAVAEIAKAPATAERDHTEIALRLRRGFLIYAAEGVASANAAAEFERCLELTGADFTDDMFATFVALYGYYAIRADLKRVQQLLETVRATLEGARQWFRPYNDAGFGMLAWYRGDFEPALALLESAAAARSEEGAVELEAVWFMPNEGTASIFTHLALARCIQGDLTGAEAELDRTAQRCAQVPFPQGPFSRAYACQMEFLIRAEAGQLDQATTVAGELAQLGERHGFDSWALAGAAQLATASALAALEGGETDPAKLQTHVATLNAFVLAWRAFGVISLLTFYEAVVARLLVAAGNLTEARQRVDEAMSVAETTGMRFHDVELLRVRAMTHTEPDNQRTDLRRAIALARSQHALIYELRCCVDAFTIGSPDARRQLLEVVGRFPPSGAWPPLARARALLE
jgi:class 3 adenylate cyclase/DNA-binding Lrp family transcriptional regulator